MLAGAVHAAERVDLIIRNGVIYDGTRRRAVRGDVAVKAGRVVATGKLQDYTADRSQRQRPRGRAGLHQHAVAGPSNR